jgi:hypothetical protein
MKPLTNLALSHRHEAPRNLWHDNRAWWLNCMGLERYWLYAGHDLQVARGRRDALLARMVESF